MKRAFTLIELLVVIAIIAILAAILFPVFAQAKEAAKKSTDLSNSKQLYLAHQMYWNDFDDQMVTSFSNGIPGDFTFMVQPYIKSRAIMLSPGRLTFTASFGAACQTNLIPGGIDNPWGEPTIWGYGYNTGHDWSDGMGLVNEVTDPNTQNKTYDITVNGIKYTVGYRDPIKVGKSATSVASPAQVILLGNTVDTTVAGLGRGDIKDHKFDDPADTCAAFRKQKWPTWGDSVNIAYVDGHSKNTKLDVKTASWKMYDAKGGVRDQPKVFNNDCAYFSDYDGGSNVGKCQTGDAN